MPSFYKLAAFPISWLRCRAGPARPKPILRLPICRRRMGFGELVDLSKGDIYYPFTYVAVSAAFLAKNRNLMRPFLAASVGGIRRFKTDKPFAKKLIAKYLRINDDKILGRNPSALFGAL